MLCWQGATAGGVGDIPRRGETVILELLILLTLANGAPVVAAKLLGRRMDWPVDGGLRLADGYRLLGPSKTLRGLAGAVLATAPAAAALGLGWVLGAAVAALAMAGDLLSSFLKRRLGRPSSSQALGLDQIPEALLPAALLHQSFNLSWGEVAVAVVAFLALELALSAVGYRLGLRDRPY